jgi:excisionase family DNA binding protein
LSTEAYEQSGEQAMAVEDVPVVSDDGAWLTLGEAAAYLGVSIYTVRRRLKRGELAGRRVRTDHGDIWEVRLTTAPKQHAVPVRLLHQEPNQQPTQQPSHAQPQPTEVHQERRQEVEHEAEETPQNAAVEAEPAGIVELVRLMGRLQEENRQIAGQAGFFRAKWEDAEAQLQQAQETIKLLQAPPLEPVDGGDATTIEAPSGPTAIAEEVSRLEADLEQARQRIAAFEAATAELEREQDTAAAEAARRPWWRFWG